MLSKTLEICELMQPLIPEPAVNPGYVNPIDYGFYSGFVDSLDSQELATLLDFMGNDPSMKGRVVEAAELVGMIPKIMKLGGLLPEDRQRVN